MLPRLIVLFVFGVLLVVALVGCGGDDGGGGDGAAASADAKPVGEPSAGSVVQYADCGDWKSGSVDERRATVRELRGQLTPQRSATAVSALSDDRAYALFQKACAPAYAGSLRLYKLYVKAQGFAPLSG